MFTGQPASIAAWPTPSGSRRPLRRCGLGARGVWVAGGYSGHGNVLGLMCGDLVAQAIAGKRHPLLERMSRHGSSPRRVWRNGALDRGPAAQPLLRQTVLELDPR